jgi:hypothetical protein
MMAVDVGTRFERGSLEYKSGELSTESPCSLQNLRFPYVSFGKQCRRIVGGLHGVMCAKTELNLLLADGPQSRNLKILCMWPLSGRLIPRYHIPVISPQYASRWRVGVECQALAFSDPLSSSVGKR